MVGQNVVRYFFRSPLTDALEMPLVSDGCSNAYSTDTRLGFGTLHGRVC